MDTNAILTIAVAVSLISAGVMLAGITFGYWRGFSRGRQQSLAPGSEIDKLAGVGRSILSMQLRLDALCEVVYQQATRIVDTHNFQLGIFEGDDYVVKIWVRDGERIDATTFPGAGKSGLIGWVRKTAQSLRIGDYQREWETLPAKPNYEAEKAPRAGLFTPLIAAGDVIGVITVQSDIPDTYTEEDQRLLSILASQAAGAIHNAQLFEQARRHADQLLLITEVGQEITAIQPLGNLLEQIVTIVHDRFPDFDVSIFTFDALADELRLRASSDNAANKQTIVLKPGEGLVGWAYQQRKTVHVADVRTNPQYRPRVRLGDNAEETILEVCVPLLLEKRVVGVLDVQSSKPIAITTDDLSVLEALGGQLAMAIQEAQAYEQIRRQNERINAMAEATRAVVSILDINDLLDEVVDLVADYFGYDRVHLFLRSGNQVVFRSGSGVHSAKWAIDRLTYDIDDNGFIAWVARTGQPLVSGDVSADERHKPGPGLEDSRSEMTVPISMGQRVLGVFDIQSPEINAFNPDDVKLVQALGDTVAVGLRNAGLFATETRRRMLAETLREVSTVLTSSLDLESVLDGILLSLERVVHYEAALILLHREDEGNCIVSAVRGSRNESDVMGEILTLDETLLDRTWELLHHMEETHNDDSPSHDHDHLFAPLQVGGKEIGTLAVDRFGPDHFNAEDVEIINTFANQAGVAIQNAQLYTAQKEEAWVSTALLQVAEATSRSTNLDEVLSTVAQITPLLAGVEWCIVFLSENKTFRVVEMEGVPQLLRDKFKGYIFHMSDWEPFQRLCDEGKPVVMMPGIQPPRNVEIDLSRVAQAVLLPLYAKGEIMGAMLIAQRDGTEPLTERKIELVSGIANQAALAIEGAQLFNAQQEEAWVTTALLSVAESVNSTLGLIQTLETLVRLTPMLVGVTRCAIMQWDEAAQAFIGGAVWGLTPEAQGRFIGMSLAARHHEFVAVLAEATEPLNAGGDQEREVPQEVCELFECDELLFLPLLAKGNLVGCMIVDHEASGEQINQRRMNILAGIAHQSALALETARLQDEVTERQRLERELEVASGIQHSFLPQQLPKLSGWGLAAYYRAARQVGGDFYDFIPLRGDKWGIVVADVADKGVPAALFMALSRTNIRAAAYSRDDPMQTLMRVNELLLADSRSDLFVTVWYGVWDPATGELTYANGGHNAPLLVRADGSIEELAARGIALNVIDVIHLEEKTVILQSGDVLTAYTDGLTDALRGDGAEFGVSGLRNVLAHAPQYGAEELRQRIVDAVDDFVGDEPQFDDLTMIILKNEGVPNKNDAPEDSLTVVGE
ncbi:MAG: GAF domain-containing protein [Anaerolineae bacterium]|nr:GAF domain-containing protein [Anaerolineae bacterium]